MEKDLISIIVCIYNREKYLPRCIESIINQTYNNLQIILIDDGSTDNSKLICENYAKKDNRILVVHQQNQGIAKTRNVGLELANGKYLCFCDSDDYYDKNYCAELYNDLIKNNSDFSMCDILQIDIKKNKKYLISKEINSFVVEKNKFMNLLFYERRLGNPINKLYKSKIIKSCKYPEGLIHEDTYIIYDILSKCNRISYLNKPLYNRVIHDNSITSSKKKNRLDEIKAFEHWMDGFNKNNDHINFVNATCMTLDSIIRSYILLFNILDLQEKKNLLLKFNDYYKKIDIKINLTKKLKYLLFKINPNLLKLIYCLINKK